MMLTSTEANVTCNPCMQPARPCPPDQPRASEPRSEMGTEKLSDLLGWLIHVLQDRWTRRPSAAWNPRQYPYSVLPNDAENKAHSTERRSHASLDNNNAALLASSKPVEQLQRMPIPCHGTPGVQPQQVINDPESCSQWSVDRRIAG